MKILRVISSSSNQAGFSRCMASLDLEKLSYEEILNKLKGEFLLYPNGFKAEMSRLGWEVLEIVPDSVELQSRWAQPRGMGLDVSASGWKEKLFLQQIESFQPQVLYFERGCGWSIFSDSFRGALKTKYPFLKLVVGFWGNTGVDCKRFIDIDWMFAMDGVFHKLFQNQGIPSQICHHSFEPQILDRIDIQAAKNKDFVFAGVSGFGLPDHRERYLDLLHLMQYSALRIWCLEYPNISLKTKIRSKLVRGLGVFPRKSLSLFSRLLTLYSQQGSTPLRVVNDAIRLKNGAYFDDWYFHQKPLKALYPTRVSAPVFGLDYFQLIQQSKVILNRHVDAKGHYGNMRTFEVCGLGGCLLTDRGKEMEHLFQLDDEILSFESAEECLEKAKYLLDHETVRREIGKKAQARVLKSHVFSHRAQEIDERLRHLLRGKA